MRVVCFNRDSHMNLPPNPGHFIHRDLGKYRYCQYLFCRLINMSRTADANAMVPGSDMPELSGSRFPLVTIQIIAK